MNSMDFRVATQEDLDYVRQNPYELAVKNYPDSKVPEVNAFSAIVDGKVLGVFGLQVRWEGLGIFWMICRSEFLSLGVRTIITAVSRTINIMISDNNLYRAEMYVRTDFPKAARMAEFLGFNKECIMKQFFPDKNDSYLYSKVI